METVKGVFNHRSPSSAKSFQSEAFFCDPVKHFGIVQEDHYQVVVGHAKEKVPHHRPPHLDRDHGVDLARLFVSNGLTLDSG